MPTALQRADLLDVEVPRRLWSRGKRPFKGSWLRWSLATLMFLTAALVPAWPIRIALALVGVAIAVLLPPIVDARLEPLGRAVAAADRTQAGLLLRNLEHRRLVALFAPLAWVALQKGKLHLVLGDARAAAKAFAESARLSGEPNAAPLASAQAHALAVAGDVREARALLSDLDERKLLGARDRLDYGILMLEEGGRVAQARAHLEAAREAIGGHPRVLAALSLALAKSDEIDEARKLLEAAEADEAFEDDAQAKDLARRARKLLRPVMEAEEKRARRSRGGSAPAAKPTPRGEVRREAEAREKKSRKERKKEKRREARAEEEHAKAERAEADKRTAASRAEAEKREAASRVEAEKRAAAARAKADAERRAEEARKKEAAKKVAPLVSAPPSPPRPASPAAPLVSAPPSPQRPASPGAPVFKPPPLPVAPAAPKVASVKAPVAPAAPDQAVAPEVPAMEGWDDLLGGSDEKKPIKPA